MNRPARFCRRDAPVVGLFDLEADGGGRFGSLWHFDQKGVGLLFPPDSLASSEKGDRFDFLAEQVFRGSEGFDSQLGAAGRDGEAVGIERAVLSDGEAEILRAEFSRRRVFCRVRHREFV